ncbi:MAG TPA: gfo/Idh/MocA family oxidoreductase, partial [Firmicutes bacterium]|nr:gfo/Idh/MocA family oxidoreductase [Bacillota bacterium]
LAGKNGLIRYDSRKASPIMAQSLTHAQVGPVAVNPYRLELEDMVEAIREDRAPRVSVSDAFGSLEVALAAIESARTGQVVELEGGDYRGR